MTSPIGIEPFPMHTGDDERNLKNLGGPVGAHEQFALPKNRGSSPRNTSPEQCSLVIRQTRLCARGMHERRITHTARPAATRHQTSPS